jgi:cytochrome b6-f complex iron-sulfur subunit
MLGVAEAERPMSPFAIVVAVVMAAGIVLILAVYAVAAGHGAAVTPRASSSGSQRMSAVMSPPKRPTRGTPDPTPGPEPASPRPPPDPGLDREPVTEDEYNATRRQFFNRATYAVFGLFLLQFASASLVFMWPKLKGGFGTLFNAGSVDVLKAEVIQGGTVVPKFFSGAQAWVVPMELDLLPGSSYETLPSIVTGGEADGVGLMALWMRCPHLGCRVPECIPSQGFECPCHGSKFNIHGEYAAGPSPRNMDRFAVSTNEAGELIIDTGTIIQTARSKTYPAEYPQGPFCV